MAAFDLEVGSTVSHFRLEKILGEGGMGAVYLAEDLTLSRRVAIKFMKRSLLAQQANEQTRQNIEQRFIREAKSAAAINHPNVAQIYEANFESDNWFIAMEFIDGSPLQSMLEAKKALSPDEILSLTRQVIMGLKHAWDDYKIIHRDIKPANIMVTRSSVVKIVDLGLAKPVSEVDEEMPDLTGAGVPIGTPQYMAPEQATGNADLDYRADIFALGATIYELCTGSKAFSGKTAPMIYMAQLGKKYEPISRTRSDLPDAFVQLIDRMLEPKPENRIGSYDEILSVLAGCGGRTSQTVFDLPDSTGVVTDRSATRLTAVLGLTSLHSEFYPADFLIADRYRVLSAIGKSRAGYVYRCLDKEVGVECAVKSLFPNREFPAEEMPVIKRNLQRLLQVSHPNLVQIRDLREDPGTGELFVVMELLAGRNLRQYTHQMVTDHGDLSVEMIAPVLERIAKAVDSVHAAVGFAHQDLKPESIYLVRNDTEVKLLDHGIVEPGELPDTSQAGLASHEVSMGSPDYLAPEQWRSQPATLRSDLYSLAVDVYEMLSHRLPFWLRDNEEEVTADEKERDTLDHHQRLYDRLRERVINEAPQPLGQLSQAQNRALLRALAKAPEDRYANCEAFFQSLTRKRSMLVPMAAAAAGVAGLIGAAMVFGGGSPPPPEPPPDPPPSSQHAGQNLSPLDPGGGSHGGTGGQDAPPVDPIPDDPTPVVQIAPGDPGVNGTGDGGGQTPGDTIEPGQPDVTVTAAVGDGARDPVAPDPAAAARLAMQREMQLRRQANDARRLREALQVVRGELQQKALAVDFVPELDMLIAGADKMVADQEYPKAIAAFRQATEFAHDITAQVQMLAREEALDMQQTIATMLRKLEPYKGADAEISERIIRCDVSLALAREAFRREDYEESIPAYEKVITECEAILALAEQRYVPAVGKDYALPKLGLELVWIAALESWVGRYEVTNEQFRSFKPGHDSKKAEGFSLNGDKQPVVEVSYHDAVGFCQWLNVTAADSILDGYEFRIPSKAEWKTFARCGGEPMYPWGSEWPPSYGNFGNQEVFPTSWKLDGYTDPFPVTCPVDKSGRNAWGLYGVTGNVWEWTSDRSGELQSITGGGWTSCSRRELACDPRKDIRTPLDKVYDNIGFRVMLSRKR